MALFESYERRVDKINAVLAEYGISSIEECKEITLAKGVRYLEMTEGYCTRMALDEDNQVIGYEFVSLGKMTDFIKKGMEPNEAYEKSKGTYGRFNDAVKCIDPRKE
ncbi:MAG: GGGtGRT protein [Clostridia bacterium]|nr:GGGtGRT protein [Clostridia bacterium]